MGCPRDDLLTAYFDNEIGRPWDAPLAAHVAACERCRAKLAGWRAVAERLRREEVSGLAEAARRVRQRIDLTLEDWEECADAASDAAEGRVRADRNVPFFRRQVLLPVPVLAGGLAAMFILVASLFFFLGKNGSDLVQARAELENLKTIQVYYAAPQQDQFGILSNPSPTDQVVFELPGNNAFKVGQPQIIYVKERK
jgi:hypothetical protein